MGRKQNSTGPMIGILRRLKPSRKSVTNGDIFVMQLIDQRYVFGRVINVAAALPVWGIDIGDRVDINKVTLVYIYNVLSDAPMTIQKLTKDDLLLPPILIDNSAWRDGAFETVAHDDLKSSDRFKSHCFHLDNVRFYDEHGVRVEKKFNPCGEGEMFSWGLLARHVYEALGLDVPMHT